MATLTAPYYIFVRCDGALSDCELLERFGLTYRAWNSRLQLGRYLLFADEGPWTMIADDWAYTLWYLPTTRPAIQELGRRYDVFACSVGECDASFDFVYYCGGQLARSYVVEDHDFRGGQVVENTGEPLWGEAEALQENIQRRIVLRIAESLGIKTDYTVDDVRVYVPLESGRTQVAHNSAGELI